MINKERCATEEEIKIFRRGVGQLGWIEGTTRPELGFAYCQLSTIQSKPKVSDFAKYSKAVKDLKMRQSFKRISQIDLASAMVKVFSDASWGNLDGGGSQMGFIIFLNDKNDRSVPISWSSRRTKRVARSTLTAESLAAIEAVDNAILIKAAVEDVLGRHIPPIKTFVDNKSLAEVVKTTCPSRKEADH